MVEVVWSARSLRDIEEIADFISKDSLQYAEAQVTLFFVKAEMLQKHPLIGRQVPELRVFNVRQILCGHYRIIYEIVTPRKVGIITIHHQARKFESNPAIKRLITKKGKKD